LLKKDLTLSNATDKVELGEGVGSNFIPSFLDGDLSPLEVILNCEILINIMILVHIIIIVLILIQKFNVKIIKKSSVGFIRKYLNKYNLNKVENLINKVGEFNNKYLSILIVINVIIIIFYVLLNVYVNIELSSNLNGYIYDHVKFHIKEGGILFLLLNYNIKCNCKYAIDLENFVDSVWSKLLNYLNYVFEPVQHLLFILTVLILIFFISFLFNVSLFIFSDRLMRYFTNKYILWYLNFNKKIIAFEIIILSGWIGYLLYVNLIGLHYLSTHPVNYSSIGV